MKRLALFLVPILWVSLATAQEESDLEALDRAAESLAADLEAAVQKLTELRERIAEEKPPLAKETNRIAAELREVRRQADLVRTREETARAEAEDREKEISAWRSERIYVDSLLADFQSTEFATRPVSRWEEPLALGEEVSPWDALEAAVAELAGGTTARPAPGRAVDGDGVLVAGTFFEAGPAAWFVSEDTTLSGLVTSEGNLRPRVVDGTASAGRLADLLEGRPARLTLDPTLGNAIALSETTSDPIEHIRDGGFWMIPILLLGAIALVTAIVKWIQLSRIRPVAPSTVEQVIQRLNEGDYDSAREIGESVRHPASSILVKASQRLSENPGIARDDLEESLYERFLDSQAPLHRGLPLIAIASATAPLLGLLGTVTGMIETFRLINIFGTGDAKTLASGISEALVTTEFGLIVAIPSLILHALLSRKAKAVKSAMEMTSMALLNGIRLQSPPSSSSRETSAPATPA